MLTQNSAKELLYSIPVRVSFAGFESDTLRLAQGGWDLSMNQQLDPLEGGCFLQLALRHEGAKLYGLSDKLRIKYHQMMGATLDRVVYAQYLSSMEFRILHVAPGIQFMVVPVQMASGMSLRDQFLPIDAVCSERVEQQDMRSFKFFKTFTPNLKDIVVAPHLVPELLDMVMKAQGPTLEEIKARGRSRENTRWVRDQLTGVKPAHEVQAQIITLAG